MMEKKKIKVLTVLIGILLVLLAIYFGLQSWNKGQEKKAQEKEEAEAVYATDTSDIVGVKYDAGNGEMNFEKEGDAWVYTQDKDFPLAQSYIEQIVSDFGHLKAERELKDGDSLKDYGLEDPVYTVVLTGSDGTETSVYFGNMTGESYYVTVNDSQRVYTVASSYADDLQYSLDDMAQLDTYPNIGSGNLKKEVISRNGTDITYDSENDEDSENIAAVAGGLGAVTLSEAADYSVEDKDLPGYGLDEGSRIGVEATYTEDDEEKILKLYIGGEDANGNRYVMLNDSRIVYLISDDVCKNILNEE